MTFITDNKKAFYIILVIILFPLLILLFEMFITVLFGIGQFVGTYFRVIYERVIC